MTISDFLNWKKKDKNVKVNISFKTLSKLDARKNIANQLIKGRIKMNYLKNKWNYDTDI